MWRCQQTQQHEPFAKCDAPIWNDPVALVLLSEAKHPQWIPHCVRNDKKSMRNDIACHAERSEASTTPIVMLNEVQHPRWIPHWRLEEQLSRTTHFCSPTCVCNSVSTLVLPCRVAVSVSPVCTLPTPSGVPVKIRSPASKPKMCER